MSFKVSASPDVDLLKPPDGASFQPTAGGFEAISSTRSYEPWVLIPFLCAWSGLSMWGIYGRQIITGVFSWKLCLFGVPFLIGTIWLGGYTLLRICGRFVIRKSHDEGSVFQGIGDTGWTRRFPWLDVESVELIEKEMSERPNTFYIEFRFRSGRRRLRCASLLKRQRRAFLLHAIRVHVVR